jgi:acyl carrier protein
MSPELGCLGRTPGDPVAARLEAFVRLRARVSAHDSRFSRQSNLWDEGYLDSIGVVEMIGYIEATFGVAIPDEALFDPDFTNVDGIARIVSALPTIRSAPTNATT